jgi:hypothetical protein
MIFESLSIKYIAMKKILILLTALMILISCSTSKVAGPSRDELRKEKKIAQQAEVKRAVEMRRFIIKLDRLYFKNGQIIELMPRTNYIVLDGERAIISAAYIGRQYSFRPISGINMTGRTVEYELKNNISKGIYEIRMKVKNDANSFDVYVTISDNGSCNASLTNGRTDFSRYSGNLVPIRMKPEDKVKTKI